MGLTLAEDQIDAFEAFEESLYEANASRNLTRIPREDCWSRHFLDSLLHHDLIPSGSSVLDIGTGPGFPAWPLAMARPDLQVTGIDATSKMIQFLEGHRLPNLLVVHARIEERPDLGPFDCVTGRALAPFPVQLEISARPCRVGGVVLPMRTPTDYGVELGALEVLGLMLEEVAIRALPGAEGVRRVFPVYRKVAATRQGWPRRWAEIVKKPLPSLPTLLPDSVR